MITRKNVMESRIVRDVVFSRPVTQRISDKQRLAWKLRHERGWSVTRIARKLRISQPAVSQLLNRVPTRDPLAPATGRPRVVRPFSLSDVFNA